MMKINVTYAVNELAGTGKIHMQKHIARVMIDADLADEKAVYDEAMEKLIKLEMLPRQEIKILGFSAL